MAGDFDEDFARMLDDCVQHALQALTPEQLAKVEQGGEAFAERLADAVIPEVIERTAAALVERLKADAPGMLAHRREVQHEFEQKLAAHWGTAFDLSAMVMKVAHEAGESFYAKHVPPDGQHDYVFEALGRLHARACRISEEVLVLLKAGFGQAGLARWRALYEVAVVADFIAESGDECAERYFAHEGVESYKAMKEFQEHADALGDERYPEAQFATAKQHRDELLARWGSGFGGSWGWAQAELRRRDPAFSERATFRDIEASVKTPHMRPYYRMASHGVHANTKGITWEADSLPSDRGLVLLTGPSPAGLADPGHAMVLTLTRMTACLLGSRPGAAAAYIVTVLAKLSDEAGDAYLHAHQALEADEARESRRFRPSPNSSNTGSFSWRPE